MNSLKDRLTAIRSLYTDGFRNMPGWGRKMWIIIIIKLFIIFAVLRLFFFPDFMKKNFRNDSDRSNYIIEKLTIPS